MAKSHALTDKERNTQNEYTTSIAREMSRKSHADHGIITIEKRATRGGNDAEHGSNRRNRHKRLRGNIQHFHSDHHVRRQQSDEAARHARQ